MGNLFYEFCLSHDLVPWFSISLDKEGLTMYETKNPLKSKTLNGVLIMLVAYFFERFNINLGPEAVADVANELGMIVGSLLAIKGRMAAKTNLSFKKDDRA